MRSEFSLVGSACCPCGPASAAAASDGRQTGVVGSFCGPQLQDVRNEPDPPFTSARCRPARVHFWGALSLLRHRRQRRPIRSRAPAKLEPGPNCCRRGWSRLVVVWERQRWEKLSTGASCRRTSLQISPSVRPSVLLPARLPPFSEALGSCSRRSHYHRPPAWASEAVHQTVSGLS